jgi:hypothetical protein
VLSPKAESNMPRYYFHVMDGRATIDEDGTELPDVEAARDEAIRTAGEILASGGASLADGHPWNMTVADQDGKTVLTLRFKMEIYC